MMYIETKDFFYINLFITCISLSLIWYIERTDTKGLSKRISSHRDVTQRVGRLIYVIFKRLKILQENKFI